MGETSSAWVSIRGVRPGLGDSGGRQADRFGRRWQGWFVPTQFGKERRTRFFPGAAVGISLLDSARVVAQAALLALRRSAGVFQPGEVTARQISSRNRFTTDGHKWTRCCAANQKRAAEGPRRTAKAQRARRFSFSALSVPPRLTSVWNPREKAGERGGGKVARLRPSSLHLWFHFGAM